VVGSLRNTCLVRRCSRIGINYSFYFTLSMWSNNLKMLVMQVILLRIMVCNCLINELKLVIYVRFSIKL